MTDFRALCAELTGWIERSTRHYIRDPDVLIRARAALAEADEPVAPTPPADGEVAELVVELRRFRSVSCHRAAELLERQALVPEADWSRQEVAFPGEQYHEDMGAVTWWRLPVNEPPWVGTPNDSDWPGYHTHFTPAPPVPVNVLPLPEAGE